jgi:hypothetical protein
MHWARTAGPDEVASAFLDQLAAPMRVAPAHG